MENVLSLQGLASFAFDEWSLDSNTSGTCSDASSGTGQSSCSISCDETATMDW